MAYARFSSDNQRDESIDAQFRAINKYAQQNDIEIIARYEDRAKRGTTAEREGLQRMVRDSKNGEFQMVIVHKFDRFARNRFDSIFYKNLLAKNGARVVSVLEYTDDTPESKMLEGYDLNALAHTLTAFAPRVSGNYTITCGYGIIKISENRFAVFTAPLALSASPNDIFIVSSNCFCFAKADAGASRAFGA